MTGLVAAILAIMVALSVAAHFLIPAEQKTLVMQWSLDGKPVWRANRLVALLFSPVLAIVMCIVLFAAGSPAGVVALAATAMAAGHALHLALVLRKS